MFTLVVTLLRQANRPLYTYGLEILKMSFKLAMEGELCGISGYEEINIHLKNEVRKG